MSELFIPPSGISFRLFGVSSHKVLFSKNSFGQVDSKNIYDDQWWKLVTDESKPGLFQIKSNYTQKVLYAKKDDVGHMEQHLDWSDQWFKIDPGEGEHQSHFRLWDHGSNRVIVSRPGTDYPGDFEAEGTKFPDQYFLFAFEDMEIYNVKYELSKGKITVDKPTTIGHDSTKNDGPSEVTGHLSVSEEFTHTSSFDYTSGFTIKAESTATLGVPGVAEGKLQYSGSTTQEMKWGKESSVKRKIQKSYDVKVPPHSKSSVVVTATFSEFDVPCTVYSRSKKTGISVETHAIFHGVSYWNIHGHFS